MRKLEHGSLPGQSSGVVSIPFVTLTEVKEVIQKNSESYRVQAGDTVSKLIARNFGRYGTHSYQEAVKLFQAANPQVTNLDLIYAGQKVYLPEPTIREKAWYASMYDEKGELRETMRPGQPGVLPGGAKAAQPETAAQTDPPQAQDLLTQAAAVVGGKLLNKGTYYVPRTQAADFEVDLSHYPMLALQDNDLVFSPDGKVMGIDQAALQRFWPKAKLVTYNPQSSVEEVVTGIFDAMGQQTAATADAAFVDGAVRVTVTAKWVKEDSAQRRLCITPVSSADQQTPESVRRYLEQHGILLKELLPGGQAAPARAGQTAERHAVKNILALTATDGKEFVQSLTRALNFPAPPMCPSLSPTPASRFRPTPRSSRRRTAVNCCSTSGIYTAKRSKRSARAGSMSSRSNRRTATWRLQSNCSPAWARTLSKIQPFWPRRDQRNTMPP